MRDEMLRQRAEHQRVEQQRKTEAVAALPQESRRSLACQGGGGEIPGDTEQQSHRDSVLERLVGGEGHLRGQAQCGVFPVYQLPNGE